MTLRPNPLSVAIQGSKGGQGTTAAPTEAPDTLHDVARIRVLDLLMEGESAGFVHGSTNPLRDVYLNETPVCNDDDSFNFADIKIDSRSGTQNQDAMPGYGNDTQNEIGVNVELRSDAAWSQALSNLDLSAVRIRVGVDSLQESDAATGDIKGYQIDYVIELSTDGGAFTQVGSFSFNGKTTSAYERTHRIDLPTATTGWTVRVTRTTANANSATVADTTRILSYTEIIDATLRYPNSAIVGLTVDAKQFQSPPNRAYDMLGRIMSVPSNYDPVGRAYTGAWDGTLKPAWTNNPAWIFYDLVTNDRFGLGRYITPARVNKWALYTIAQYCDGLVPDGKGGTEPRFTCTLYLQTQAEAYKVLADLVSVFRGITYWSGSQIQAIADMPADPDFEYNATNVIDGKFEYAGSGRKTRYTVALVSWNDPADFGRAKVAYVPDREGIARYGVQPTQLMAVGATSESQAKRAGLWALYTSRLDTETVTWGVGQDGVLVAPGRICRIADPKRAGKRQGGRVSAAGTHTNLALWSEDFSNPVWQSSNSGTGSAAVVTPNYAAAPDGSMTACRVQLDLGAATGDQDWSAFQQDSDSPASAETGAWWVKSNTGSDAKVYLYTLDALVLATITPEWQRIEALETDPAKQDDGPTATTADLLVWHPHIEASATLGGYVPTTDAPASAFQVTVDRAPDVAAAGDKLNVMLPSGVSESQTISDVEGRAITVSAAYSETPVAEAVWTVDAASLATQTVRVLTVREQFDDGKVQYVLTGVKHNASKFDAVDNGATIFVPPTVYYPGNTQAAPSSVALTSYPVQYASSAGVTLSIGWDKPANAVLYYVQYRRDNSEWTPRRLTSTRHVDIPNVAPGTYEASVIAVNALGIESQQTISDPLVVNDPNKVPGIVDDIKAEVDAAKASADQANADLANIAADGKLTPVEKKRVILDYNVITTEQGGIDAQADAYGITTEKTAYDGKVTALTNYLATLTTPTAWNDTSGDTDIVRADFRAAFSDVYTARQTLLNAIYAGAKSKADAAQQDASKGVSLVTQLPVVNGGFEWDTPAGYGWTADAGTGWTFDRAGNTPGVGPNCAMRAAGTGSDTGAYRNIGLMGCQAGQTVKVQGLVKTVGVTGTVYVFVSWLDAGLNEIGSTAGNQVTGTTTAGSYAVGQAPTGTVYAKACLGYSNMTAGTCYVDNVVCTQHPASADEVPESASRKWAAESGADKTAGKSLDVLVDGDIYVRRMQQVASGSAWEIDNALFQQWDHGSNTTVPGWIAQSGCVVSVNGSSQTYGTYCLDLVTTSGASNYARSAKNFFVKPGDRISLVGLVNAINGAGASISVTYGNAGGLISSLTTPVVTAASWQSVSANGIVPSNASYAFITLNNAGGGAYHCLFNFVQVTVNDVRVAGSGSQLGGQRNMPYVTWGNYGGMWSGLSLTHSLTSTSCTFTASNGSYVGGDDSISYNGANVTVSGTAGSTVTYYLYYDDPSMSGGSKTLQATTSQINSLNANGRVLVDQVTVTYPTSGTSSGGGAVGCPQVDEPVIRRALDGSKEVVSAGDVGVGEYILSPSGRWLRVTYSETKLQPCVRVEFEDGEARIFSATAPLEDAAGRPVLAPFAQGRVLRHRREGFMRVREVSDAGMQWVQHITAENDYFLVGNFSHHNRKPAV